jgi:alpha-tubulin suppressor-like RCC1 family protein
MKRFVVVLTVLAMALAGVLASVVFPSAASAVTVPTKAGAYRALAPARLLDTRSGLGLLNNKAARVPAFGTQSLQVTGRGAPGNVVPNSVSAVVLNVTVTESAKGGFITVYSGANRPLASNLNFVAGQSVPNLVVVRVDATGKVKLYNGSGGTVQLVADVSGYYVSGALAPTDTGAFGSLNPTRLMDTRTTVTGGPVGAVAANSSVNLRVTGRGGVPLGASAVVLNVTATGATDSGLLKVYGTGTDRPVEASNVNFVAGQTVPNLVIAPVSASGFVTLFNVSFGSTAMVADVSGYFKGGDPITSGAFGSLAPERLLDTSNGTGVTQPGPVAPKGTLGFQVAGTSGVPAGVSAVVLNVTVTGSQTAGFITAYGSGTSRPLASNVNFVGGPPVANLVIAPVGTNGRVSLYNGSAGSTDLAADVMGYYLADDEDVTAPDLVTGLTATATGTTSIALAWTNPPADVTEVVILRAVGPTAPLTIDDGIEFLVGTATSFTDTGLTAGTQYSYSVVAQDAAGHASVAATTTATTWTQPTVSTGGANGCAITTVGGVRCWGENDFGELGNGTTISSSVPVDVVGLGAGVAALSVGGKHSCAVTSVGAVKCWGSNEFGGLGNGTTTDSLVPVGVVGLGAGVAAVSVSQDISCAVTSAGAVKRWGSNEFGGLGDGTTTDSARPVDVVGLEGEVAAVSVGGNHSCAVSVHGEVKCWGSNRFGQLGNGTTTDSAIPIDVTGVGAVAVSAGQFHSCAVTSAGWVWCWGDNVNGQLGDGTNTSSARPVGVTDLGSGIVSLSAGFLQSCAVTSAGAVKCWGVNSLGMLGDGTTTSSNLPVGVFGLGAGVAAVSVGSSQACALTSADAVKCWGYNGRGGLGDGTTTDSHIPVDVFGLPVSG